jgi:hypothetical protein
MKKENMMKYANFNLIFSMLTGTLVGLLVSSCQPRINVEFTPELLPTHEWTLQDVENFVQSEMYMSGCKEEFPESPNQQIGFQGVYSGITTREELISQFGKPTKTGQGNKEYLYFDSNLTYSYDFFMNNNIVEEFYISKTSETLQNILSLYGCPDVIVAEALSDDHDDGDLVAYNHVYYQYLQAGMWIHFEGYPVNYSSFPIVINYEKPLSLSSFLQVRFDPRSSKIVSFSEAVQFK